VIVAMITETDANPGGAAPDPPAPAPVLPPCYRSVREGLPKLTSMFWKLLCRSVLA
jgi:hypothetical protein